MDTLQSLKLGVILLSLIVLCGCISDETAGLKAQGSQVPLTSSPAPAVSQASPARTTLPISPTQTSIVCRDGQRPCGGSCYDTRTESCCNARVYKGTGWLPCNDQECYNTHFASPSCCQGTVFEGSYVYCGGSCQPSTAQKPGCCNDRYVYDTETETCCGLVYPGKVQCSAITRVECGQKYCPEGWKCCSTKAGPQCYDPEILTCKVV